MQIYKKASFIPPPPHLPFHYESPNPRCLPPPLALPSRTNPDTVYINTTLSSHHYTLHIPHPAFEDDLTEGSETSAKHNLTPGKYPKNHIQGDPKKKGTFEMRSGSNVQLATLRNRGP
jgi:hypothetical protein